MFKEKKVRSILELLGKITFAKNFKKFTADKNYMSHIGHRPGSEAEVDWSG